MKYKTVSQFANDLGVTKQAIHQAIKQGRLKGQKVGNVWLLAISECSRWSADLVKIRRRLKKT